MRLWVKHANQQTVTFSDYSGGLNTESTIEGIGENQLAMVENMEVDHATGKLRTISGTEAYIRKANLFAVMYDEINRKILLVTQDKKVYIENEEIGTLSGELYPIYTSWENGILIASGGKLQYYNGTELKTIENSPESSSVYIRSGRVLVTSGNEIRYSGIGDEENWTDNTNDYSSSKFIEVGYKEGGNFLGLVNLSQYILIVKDNRRLYRLSGEFPEWTVQEISRNVECNDRLGICAVSDAVYILGNDEMEGLAENEFSGNVKPANVGILVKSELKKLSKSTKIRYVPPANQIFLIDGTEKILVYDLVFKSWYARKYNEKVIDVIVIDDEVYLLRENELSKENETIFTDVGKAMTWRFRGRRLVSQHAFLLKKTQVAFIPLNAQVYSGEVRVGAVKVVFPIPRRQLELHNNRSQLWRNRTQISNTGRGRGTYFSELPMYENQRMLHGNRDGIFSRRTIIKENRNVFRSKYLDVTGEGKQGGVIIEEINIEIAEV